MAPFRGLLAMTSCFGKKRVVDSSIDSLYPLSCSMDGKPISTNGNRMQCRVLTVERTHPFPREAAHISRAALQGTSRTLPSEGGMVR